MCPELAGANLQTENAWPWPRRLVTSDPPRLIDGFRHFHPAARSFSGYHTPYRASSSRLDHTLVFPAASELFAPTSATKRPTTSRSHTPLRSPPWPFSETPATKRKFVRKLTEQEDSKHHDSLAPLAKWCESTLPRFDSLSSADIERFTDAVLEEVATSYHTITASSQPTPPALVKKLKAYLNSLPPPPASILLTPLPLTH